MWRMPETECRLVQDHHGEAWTGVAKLCLGFAGLWVRGVNADWGHSVLLCTCEHHMNHKLQTGYVISRVANRCSCRNLPPRVSVRTAGAGRGPDRPPPRLDTKRRSCWPSVWAMCFASAIVKPAGTRTAFMAAASCVRMCVNLLVCGERVHKRQPWNPMLEGDGGQEETGKAESSRGALAEEMKEQGEGTWEDGEAE